MNYLVAVAVVVPVAATLWIVTCLFGDVCDLLVYWWQKR